jgi:hypothetical protein
VSEWQPIETAPKDGRHMLLAYRNRLNKWRTIIGSWESFPTDEFDDDDLEIMSGAAWYEASWVNEQALKLEEAPTHWMPLPSAPSDEVEHK